MNEESLAEIVNGEKLVLIGRVRAWDYVNAFDIVTRALYEMVQCYFPKLERRSAREVIEERVVEKYKSEGYVDIRISRTVVDKNKNPRDDFLAIYGRREVDGNREAA